MCARICGLVYVVLSLGTTTQVFAQSGQEASLPPDVDPVSFSRLPPVSREDMSAEDQRIYDMVVGDGPPPVTGPRAISFYSPKVAEAFHLLNEYLRFEGVLEPRHVEVAILVAAWEFEQQYEWSAHERAALDSGAPQSVVDTIKFDRAPVGLSPEETLIIRLGRQLLREHELSSTLFAEAVELFGQQGIVELVTLMGDYIMAGLVLTAVDQRQPPDRPALLPPR